MKPMTGKGRELLYLSLTVVLTISFSIFCISVNVIDTIPKFFTSYRWMPHAQVFFNMVLGYLCILIWILYRQWRIALHKQRELEDIISSINPYVLMVVDKNNTIIKCNSAVRRMLGYEREEVVNLKTLQSIIEISSPGSTQSEGHGGSTPFSIGSATAKKINGEPIHLEVIMGNLEHSKGKVVLLHDVTERKRAEESLKELTSKLAVTNAYLDQLAKIDPLTELLNRRGLQELLDLELKQARREGSRVCAILVDCDDFKQINDTLGHAVGDVVLTHIGKRLKTSLRSSDHIARVGGDEFLILLPDSRLAEATAVSEKLRLAVSTSPLPVSSESVKVTASLGVALLPFAVSSIEEILSLTRLPLQRSKCDGKNLVSSAGESSERYTPRGVSSTDKIEKLLQGDSYYPVYQPIYHLTDERLVGYELLGRSSVVDLEMPNDFFNFSLEHNILTHVDLQCLRSCIAATSHLRPKARFHVNLFPSTMLATPIENLLKIFPPEMERGSFCVEISEQQFIGDPSYFKEYALALKESGIIVAIDDLGFGRSSLESLIILEPDLIKIDRVYVDGISRDAEKRRSLERLLHILNALSAENIAEGIESREDLTILREMGVQYGQGYLWGIPAPVQHRVQRPSEIRLTLAPDPMTSRIKVDRFN